MRKQIPLRMTYLCVLVGVSVTVYFNQPTIGYNTSHTKADENDEAAKQIDLYTANLFHSRLLNSRNTQLLTIHYLGAIRYQGTETGAHGSMPNAWAIMTPFENKKSHSSLSSLGKKKNNATLFVVSLWPKKDKKTVATVKIGGRTIYLKLRFIRAKKTVDDKLKELDERSIRDFLLNTDDTTQKVK